MRNAAILSADASRVAAYLKGAIFMELELGDVVFVHRPWGYDHYGVYIGQEQVIHYCVGPDGKSGGGGSGGIVMQTTLRKFLDTSKPKDLHVAFYPKIFCTKSMRKQCVKRAKSALGERKYNLISHNCEHFARWCRTGMSSSTQVAEVEGSLLRFALKVGTDMLCRRGTAITWGRRR